MTIRAAVDGRTVISGEVAPTPGIGRIGDYYRDTVAGLEYGPKTTSGWGTGSSTVGPRGIDGWTRVTRFVPRGDDFVEEVIDWTGGEGAKPAVGVYIGGASATGYVANIVDAANVRGPAGALDGIDAETDAGALSLADGVPITQDGLPRRATVGAIAALGFLAFDNKALAEAESVSPAVFRSLYLRGYDDANDGGGARYKYVGSQPIHDLKLQTADGSWWEIDESIVTARMAGAKGTGLVDDTAAIARLFKRGGNIAGVEGDSYLITQNVFYYSNIVFDGNGCEFLRSFEDGFGFLRNATMMTTWSDENVVFRNFRARSVTGGRGGMLSAVGVRNFTLENFSWVMEEPYIDGVSVGANALEIIGEDIFITDFYINNYAGDKWADAVHLGTVKNCVISNFTILAGDDCFGGAFRPMDWTNAGPDEASDGISITNGVCASKIANVFRFGAASTADLGSLPSKPNQVWKNVIADNVVVLSMGTETGVFFDLDDRRSPADINDVNYNITFSNIRFNARKNGGLIRVLGNPDPFNAANYGQYNYDRVVFDDISAETDLNVPFARCGGVKRLTISGGDFQQSRDVVGSGSFAFFSQIQSLRINDTYMDPYTTAYGMDISMCDEIVITDPKIKGSGNESRGIRLNVTELVVAPRLLCQGGFISGAIGGIGFTGAGTINTVSVLGTYINSSSFVSRVSDVSSQTTTWDIQLPQIVKTGLVTILDTTSSIAVTFTVPMPDANYGISLSPANNTLPFWSSRTTTGFTINRSGTSGGLTVAWTATLV